MRSSTPRRTKPSAPISHFPFSIPIFDDLGIPDQVRDDGVGSRDDGERIAPEGRAWCRDNGKEEGLRCALRAIFLKSL